MSGIIYKELSDRIIGLAIEVHKEMGPGFLEQVYEECMCIELERNAIPYRRQQVYQLYYRNIPVGKYIADIVVAGKIVLELKSTAAINQNMEVQLLNYLHVSGIRVGYIINFRNAVAAFKRLIR